MYKKIMTLFMTAIFCFVLAMPAVVKANQVDTLEVTNDAQPSREEIQKKNEELFKKWSALSTKQKNDIYRSVKGTIDAQAKFLDKLVKYELMTDEEAKMIKDEMYAKFDEMKQNDALFQGPNGQNASQDTKDAEQKDNTVTEAPAK